MSREIFDIADIFVSLQGEGAHAGTRAIFVRFAGCNRACSWCDTEHSAKLRNMPRDELCHRLALLRDAHLTTMVVLTGGEPLLHVDEPLLEALAAAGFAAHLETNGTLPPPPGPIAWIAVSPKDLSPAALARVAYNFKFSGIDELKIVLGPGEALPEFPWGLMREPDNAPGRARRQWVSPRMPVALTPATQAEADASIAHARDLVLARPGWALTMQAHKVWGAR